MGCQRVLFFEPSFALVFGDFVVGVQHALLELCHEFRVFFGEIVFFTKVLLEVEEKDLLFRVWDVFGFSALFDEKLVITNADALEVATRGVVDELVSGPFVVSLDESGNVHAIDFTIPGKRGSGEPGNGGEEVDGSAKLVTGCSRWNATGRPHDTGDTLSSLESGSFAFAKWTGGSTMVFELKPGAVVGGEDEVGIFGEFQFAKKVGDPPDLLVDVLDDVDVGLLGIRVAFFIGDVERDVRHGVGEVEEKGFVLVRLDELEGSVGIAPGDRSLVNGKFDDFVVFHERGLPLGESRFRIVPKNVHASPPALGFALVVWVVHVVRVRDSVVGIEALGNWEGFLVVAKVPFANAGGGISVALEVIGDGGFFRIHSAGRGWKEHVLVHSDPFGIASRQEGGAGRGTDWRGDHEAGEATSLLGKSVNMWSLDRGGSEATKITVTLVIGKDDDEVWLFSRSGQKGERGENQGDKSFHRRKGWNVN